MDSKTKPINLTGLWKSKDGNSLVGSVGGVRYVVTKNRYKEKDNQPDYQLVLFQIEKEDKAAPEDEGTPF